MHSDELSVDTLKKLNKDELKERCRQYNLHVSGVKAQLQERLCAFSQEQRIASAHNQSTSSLASTHQINGARSLPSGEKVGSFAQERQLSGDLADTAESPEHTASEQHLPDHPANTPLPELTEDTQTAKETTGRVPHSVNQYPYQSILQPQPEQTFAPVNEQADERPSDDNKATPHHHVAWHEHPVTLWLLLPAFGIAILACLLWSSQKPISVDPSLMCRQTMRLEPLAQLLTGVDAKLTLAEVWQGRGVNPHKAGGVLLACSDAASCAAAATAVAQSLPEACSHGLHHFLPQQHSGGQSSTVVGVAGPEAAGQTQKALVTQLQQCSHTVVIVDSIDTVPTATLPVLITALSEQGHFEHSGKQVDATKALFVGILQVPPTILQQEDEETLARAVKQHLIQALRSRGAGQSLGSEAGSQTDPLRGRFDYVAEVRLPKTGVMDRRGS